MEPEPGVVGEAMDLDCPPPPSAPPAQPQAAAAGTSRTNSTSGGGGGTGALSAASTAARLTWERANEVTDASDEHLKYNVEVHQSIVNAKPWVKDPHYFKSVKISAVALLKMLIHAHSGGVYEVGSCVHQYVLNAYKPG